MIRSERIGAVAVVTIDRPDRRNALDDEHERELAMAIRVAAAHAGVHAIVLTGSGTVFCSGADLRQRLPSFQRRVEGGDEPPWSFGGMTGPEPVSVPVVAALNGHAVAGGLELALACDIRICVPDATFTMAEVRWAITPGAGGTQRLPRLIGPGVALDLLLTARPMPADEALRSGLVSRIVDPADLLAEALAIASTIAANGPLAIDAVRRVVAGGAQLDLPAALQLERDSFLATMRTADAREGSTAFAEKRTPTYQGE